MYVGVGVLCFFCFCHIHGRRVSLIVARVGEVRLTRPIDARVLVMPGGEGEEGRGGGRKSPTNADPRRF